MTIAGFLVVGWSSRLLPFCEECWWGNFLYPRPQELNWLSAFKTWDGQHYLYLAEKWYSPGHGSNAFFPLWPLLIGVVGRLIDENYMLAGLGLAQIFSLVGIVIFYALVAHVYSQKIAYRASLMLLAFPTSFYMHLIYTEALFITLVAGFLLALYKGRFWWASLLAALLSLAREPGLTMIVPTLVAFYATRLGKKFTLSQRIVVLVGFVVGYGVYMLIMRQATGLFSGMYLHGNGYVGNYSVGLLFRPWEWFGGNFLNLSPTLHGFNTSIINRLFFAGLAVVTLVGRKYLDRVMMATLLVLGWVPALTGYFMAYPRFLLPVLPIYIVMALLVRRHYLGLVMGFLMLQMLFLIMHALNYWVA